LTQFGTSISVVSIIASLAYAVSLLLEALFANNLLVYVIQLTVLRVSEFVYSSLFLIAYWQTKRKKFKTSKSTGSTQSTELKSTSFGSKN